MFITRKALPQRQGTLENTAGNTDCVGLEYKAALLLFLTNVHCQESSLKPWPGCLLVSCCGSMVCYALCWEMIRFTLSAL